MNALSVNFKKSKHTNCTVLEFCCCITLTFRKIFFFALPNRLFKKWWMKFIKKINLRKIRVCVTRFVYFTFGTIYYFEVDIETFRLVFLSHMVMLVTTNCLNFSIWNPPQIFSYSTKFNQFFPRNCDAHKRNKKIWNVIEKKNYHECESFDDLRHFFLYFPWCFR